jgi:hypothetical protein
MMSRFKCSFSSKSEDYKQVESQKAGKDGVLVVAQNAAPKKGAKRRSRRPLLLSLPYVKISKNFSSSAKFGSEEKSAPK